MTQTKNYADQLDAIYEAFDRGHSYTMIVNNSSMSPLFIEGVTKLRLSPVKSFKYGMIVFYARMTQGPSIRWVCRVREKSIDVRGVLQLHKEAKIPKGNVIAEVTAYNTHGVWVELNGFKGVLVKLKYSIYGLIYRMIRPLQRLFDTY